MNLSIVVPVRNGTRHLPLFLSSLRECIDSSTEIVVVDDGSDAPARSLLHEFTSTTPSTLIRNNTATGFAGATNAGINRSSGDVLLLVNTDTVLNKACIDQLRCAVRESDVGVVAPVLLYPQTQRVQHAGLIFSSTNHYHLLHHNPFPHLVATSSREVQAVAFAVCAFRREVFERLGALDEKYINGYEDLDYCLRIQREGLSAVVLSGEFHAYHWERQAGPARSASRKDNIARLWSTWGAKIRSDHLIKTIQSVVGFLEENKLGLKIAGAYEVADLTRGPGASSLARFLLSSSSPFVVADSRHHRQDDSVGSIWLPMVLPPDCARLSRPFIYVVDQWTDLEENAYWFAIRHERVGVELIIDGFDNVIPTSYILRYPQ